MSSPERDPRALLNVESLTEALRAQHDKRKPIREARYMLEDLVNDLADLAEQSDGMVRPMKPNDVVAWLIRARATMERLDKV